MRACDFRQFWYVLRFTVKRENFIDVREGKVSTIQG